MEVPAEPILDLGICLEIGLDLDRQLQGNTERRFVCQCTFEKLSKPIKHLL